MNDLLELLKIHRGRDRAITAKDLSQILNSDERFIRSKIRGLIAEGWPIASVTKPPHGYFIVTTLQEAEDYKRSLRERLIEDALRRRDFKRAVARSFNGGTQIKLF